MAQITSTYYVVHNNGNIEVLTQKSKFFDKCKYAEVYRENIVNAILCFRNSYGSSLIRRGLPNNLVLNVSDPTLEDSVETFNKEVLPLILSDYKKHLATHEVSNINLDATLAFFFIRRCKQFNRYFRVTKNGDINICGKFRVFTNILKSDFGLGFDIAFIYAVLKSLCLKRKIGDLYNIDNIDIFINDYNKIIRGD